MGFNLRKNRTLVKRLERKRTHRPDEKSRAVSCDNFSENLQYSQFRRDFISESPYSGSLFLISQTSLAVRIIEVSVMAGCPHGEIKS